ncbi:MAG TPA: hypothetical protein VGK54_18510 [Chloroflexota bacterium]
MVAVGLLLAAGTAALISGGDDGPPQAEAAPQGEALAQVQPTLATTCGQTFGILPTAVLPTATPVPGAATLIPTITPTPVPAAAISVVGTGSGGQIQWGSLTVLAPPGFIGGTNQVMMGIAAAPTLPAAPPLGYCQGSLSFTLTVAAAGTPLPTVVTLAQPLVLSVPYGIGDLTLAQYDASRITVQYYKADTGAWVTPTALLDVGSQRLNVQALELGTYGLFIRDLSYSLVNLFPTLPPSLTPTTVPFGAALPRAAIGPPRTDLSAIFGSVPAIRDIPTSNASWSYLGPSAAVIALGKPPLWTATFPLGCYSGPNATDVEAAAARLFGTRSAGSQFVLFFLRGTRAYSFDLAVGNYCWIDLI